MREKMQALAELLSQLADEGHDVQVIAFKVGPLDLRVESRGAGMWAIVDGGSVLNADGVWEYEPLPSNRDDAFIARTRYRVGEALERALSIKP